MGLGISTKCLAVSVTQFSTHNVCTYIHTYPFIIHWLRLVVVVFQEIQCLLHFHYDIGHQDVDISMYQVLSFTVFSFVSYMHIHITHSTVYTSKLRILLIIMWNIGIAKETRSGCLVHIVLHT